MWRPAGVHRTALYKARSRTNARTQSQSLQGQNRERFCAARVTLSSQWTSRLETLTFHKKPLEPRPSAHASRTAEARAQNRAGRQQTISRSWVEPTYQSTNLAPRGGHKHGGEGAEAPGRERNT